MDDHQNSPIDEGLLIRASRQGDLEAFNRLVLAYQDRAYTQACYLIGDPSAAEEVVQEAFIAVFKRLPTFHGGTLQNWLIRIVADKCLEMLCQRKPRLATNIGAVDRWDKGIESPNRPADSGERPEDCRLQYESDPHLPFCLDRLSAEYRTAIVLVDILALDYREAAKIVGCPPETIKSRLARARLQILQESDTREQVRLGAFGMISK